MGIFLLQPFWRACLINIRSRSPSDLWAVDLGGGPLRLGPEKRRRASAERDGACLKMGRPPLLGGKIHSVQEIMKIVELFGQDCGIVYLFGEKKETHKSNTMSQARNSLIFVGSKWAVPLA